MGTTQTRKKMEFYNPDTVQEAIDLLTDVNKKLNADHGAAFDDVGAALDSVKVFLQYNLW
jgi:hypothetical protein